MQEKKEEEKEGRIKHCFRKRTTLEKILFLTVIIFFASLLALIVDYHLATNSKFAAIRPSVPLCETESCKAIGSAILQSLDQSVDPCDDFYSYVCGGWNRLHHIPNDSDRYDVTRMLKDDVFQKVNDLLSKKENFTLSGFAENPITFYNSCLDKENIEKLGNAPLLQLLDDIGGWPVINTTWDHEDYDILSAMAQIQLRTSFGFVVLVMVLTDPLNTSSNILQLHKPSFGISTDVLLNQETETSQRELEHYKNFFISIADLLGAEKANLSREFDAIIQFERQLATFLTPEEEIQKFDVWYNKRTLKEIKENYTEIDWLQYLQMVTNTSLKDLGENMILQENDQVILSDTKYLANLDQLFGKKHDKHFKRLVSNYLGWRLIMRTIQYLPQQFDEALRNYSRDSGIKLITPERWKQCTTASISQFSNELSLLYIRKHFPKEVQKEVMKLVLDLMFQFEVTLNNNTWMDENTTAAALRKLRAMKTNIGFPPWMSDIDATTNYYLRNNMPIMTNNIFENDLALSQYITMEAISKIRKRNRYKTWKIAPIIINAGYNRNQNAITFPAAFLQEPLYDPMAPRFYNYAAIGSIIGHEITHGFDNEGRLRNASGEMQDWWSKSSAEHFQEKAQCFVNQYKNYQLNGVRTLPENIADNGGLRQAHAAYMEWKNKGAEVLALPNLNDFSLDQQFFLAYGTIWCAKYRPETFILQELHAPSRYRLLGTIANLPEFSEAFNCNSKARNDSVKNCVIW